MKQPRIGIYSGTFNPVHSGHISFALQAIKTANLDKVYLMPERHRPHKVDVAHFAHRIAMIRQAIRPHRNLGLIENNDITFSVSRTLPKLRHQFKDSKLVFLIGSDNLALMPSWPEVETLLKGSELVIGIRKGDERTIARRVKALPNKPMSVYLIDSLKPAVSSTKVREALRRDEHTDGVLPSVRRYSNRNWLYISLA
ncbi:MAG: nicotinate (nicotinamide) nucleotide adenylyltransferase [Candidatus Saccharimonadales bacterium]